MPITILGSHEQGSLDPLRCSVVAVIGYGNQGHAHALNLRDSGIQVVVGHRQGHTGWERAISDGFVPCTIADAAAKAELVILALPDEVQPEVFTAEIEPHLKAGVTIGFVHGLNIHFGLIKPRADVGVVMVAPKGPGQTLRERFVQGQGLPALVAVHQESPRSNARALALAWAHAIGAARAGIILTTFADECETDLFGEQAVLCGGMTWLIRAAFETLVSRGYPPELAYLECCHEVKQIADLVYERGPAGMMQAISNTAEFGAYRAGPLIVDQAMRDHMNRLLNDIRSGEFTRLMSQDYRTNFAWFAQQRKEFRNHPIEAAGQSVRKLMPWLKPR
jgi:ketol-acid reductoisomerase